MVYDSDYVMLLPIDVYIRNHFRSGATMNIETSKYNVDVFGIPYDNYEFPLTKQPSYHPTNVIPHCIIQGIVIVEFTHELLNIFALHNLEITNSIVNKFMSGKIITTQYLFIVDCIDDNLLKKGLPSMSKIKDDGRKHVHKCPIIFTINKSTVSSLEEINKLLDNVSDSKIEIEFGMSQNNATKIIV